jgi:hypothetical protein
MQHYSVRVRPLVLALAFVLSSAVGAFASQIPIGYVSWDVPFPGNSGQFDITNLTGPNSSAPVFPVVSSVSLTDLSLHVDFVTGPASDFGPGYFTLSADGLSWDGAGIAIGGSNPLPTHAVLTGKFSPLTITLDGGGTTTILDSFTADIVPSSGRTLGDGDLAVIYATEGTSTTPVPEPTTMTLIGTGLLGVFSRKRRALKAVATAARRHVGTLALVSCAIALPSTSWADVTLSTWTTPDNGVAGVTNVNITTSNFPAGTVTTSNVIASFSATCGGAVLATAPATSIKTILASTKRVNVVIPASLASGNYFVALSDSAAGDANFGSTNCSQVQVTHTSATLSACVPGSSLGINAPVNPGPVTAIVPRGWWGSSTTGVRIVQLEGTAVAGLPALISTTEAVNSCAANPATGKSICTTNSANAYLFDAIGNGFTTVTSGSNNSANFSGGSCRNCGVAVNALTNQAVINMGFSPSASNSGLQVLDLNTNTFIASPKALANEVSENISIDPTRGYVLSPSEPTGKYDIVQFNSSTGVLGSEFALSPTGGLAGEFDSAAEDCTTGIALAAEEFSSSVFITDLTQAVFTPGSPGTFTAPNQSVNLAGDSFAAGTSGITVAPGSSHQALVTGEFGGSSFAVLQLPSTSGSGTPNLVDWAYVPAICGLSAGFDPHTVTAYTSPNDGKSYGVMADWSSGVPSRLAVFDLTGILAAPRNAGTHTVTVAGGCLNAGPLLRFVLVP